jgi:GT2 family glycosyltransferase
VKLAVPTLVNYEGLVRLIDSAERGSVKPDGYLIIDNGGSLQPWLEERGFDRSDWLGRAEIRTYGENVGVPASWNLILEASAAEPVVISNDDVVLGGRTFEEIGRNAERHPFVGRDWCLFAQSPACTDRVGFYDENFWPGYYEDSDYSVRLIRVGIEPVWNVTDQVHHAGCWTTAKLLGLQGWFSERAEASRRYFVEKWGGMPADSKATGMLYGVPFNGKPPGGWTLRPRTGSW